MKRSFAVALLLVAVLASVPLFAETCSRLRAQPATADQAIPLLAAADGCTGERGCPTDLCKRVDEWEARHDAQGAIELLTAIRNSARTAAQTEQTARLAAKIDEWIAIVGRDAAKTSPTNEWQEAGGKFFEGTPSEVDYTADVERRCETGPPACAAAYAEAIEIITDATLTGRMLHAFLADDRKALVTYVTGLDQRWTDYFRKAPTQFPWELAINSAIYQRHERRGYNEPPRSQWIVAHPSAAYEYVSGGGEHFKSAVALEGIGYFARPFGGSVGVVWADRSDADRMGVAAVFHWQSAFTVGITHHRGRHGTAVLISPNIEKFFTTTVTRAREVLTRVR
jgi:hypothetical protein